MLYDKNLQVLFVSCINGTPSEKNGKGYISTLDPDGTIKWNDGPSGGIHFFGSPALASNGHLYIGANDGLLYAMQ